MTYALRETRSLPPHALAALKTDERIEVLAPLVSHVMQQYGARVAAEHLQGGPAVLRVAVGLRGNS